MKAMILAAGLGTRLKPWTDSHPKALYPVGGKPMIQRVMERLHDAGVKEFVVNVHHFAPQIIEFLESMSLDAEIAVSDERGKLLETGGGILHAKELLDDGKPFIVHNADILTDFDFKPLLEEEWDNNLDAKLITSHRDSSRKLIVDNAGMLKGWHNLKEDVYRWKREGDAGATDEVAFNGIYMLSPAVFGRLAEHGEKFGIMDFLLRGDTVVKAVTDDDAFFLDIGKPEQAARASDLFDGSLQ